MASNFKIIRHHNSDSRRLNLTGDFDGSSALEVSERQTGPREKKEIFDNDKIENCFSALVSILHGSAAIDALAALLARSDESSDDAIPLQIDSPKTDGSRLCDAMISNHNALNNYEEENLMTSNFKILQAS